MDNGTRTLGPLGRKIFTVYAIGLYAALTVASVVVSSYGLQNFRLVATFDTDESRIVSLVAEHLRKRSLDPGGFYYYGHFYETISYFVLRFYELFGLVPDSQSIGVVLRLICLLFGLLAAYALFRFGRILELPYELAVVAPILLVAMPEFFLYQRTAHPDTLQTFLMIAALAIALRRSNVTHALCSAVVAGLAFGTKYGGLVLLPFCAMPLTIETLLAQDVFARKLFKIALYGLGMLALFAFSYGIVNPYGIRDFGTVYATLQYLSHYTATGHNRTEPADPTLWIPVFTAQFHWTLLWVLGIGVLLSATALAVCGRSQGWRNLLADQQKRNRLILLLYIVAMLSYLLIAVRIREARYAFHIVPIMILLAATGYWDALKSLPKKRHLQRWLPLCVTIIFSVYASLEATRALDAAMAQNADRKTSQAIALGSFLAENYPGDTKIMADYYSYIPPKFVNADVTWEMNRKNLEEFRPDLLVLNRTLTGRWIWKQPGTKFADQKFVLGEGLWRTPEMASFVRYLLASGWKPVYEDSEGIVLKRPDQKVGSKVE